ncbi:hypothetical protein ACN469_15220 [Corallococcus terminator]
MRAREAPLARVRAHGCSLLLDEMREARTVIPRGGRAPVPVDVRIIAATHPPLDVVNPFR